ncbi:STAS domain-containing protein [Humisphaera borealis]|uniref:STAS domain-containing protein n=1 Tax=Humisphaera borealis TaxID=2807512 RepID=A0A7M2WTJ6_9BACT|nr:STAS domain-containing protein [Humisphaera borealis]QOV88584.1 STAS domain-containing protein [Humisphaera borealis]
MNTPLKIEVVEDNGLVVVKLGGEVGLAVSNLDYEFTKITVTRPSVIILDMREVTFVSSLGMALFVNLRNTIRRRDGRMFEFGAPAKVMDAFHRAKLDGLFEVRGSLAEALESAGRPMPAALVGDSEKA